MEWITSRQNPLMVLSHKLQNSRAERYRQRRYIADGTKLLEEAVRWDPNLEIVILQEGLTLPFPLPEQVRQVSVPAQLMRQISAMDSPQGALFLGRIPMQQASALKAGSLILDGIQDPGNLGTILRTADALEIPVYLTEGCADPYSPKTIRASMGAMFRTRPVQTTRQALIDQSRTLEIPLYATALSAGARDLRQVGIADGAVVIGSEGQGVSDACLQAAAEHVIIPMNPRCESLNAAVAATIVMWELNRCAIWQER
ncbi:MAG: RNA methyltransferase [Clostridiales bacterium]|nr:RNA methyltransferase [Clostridiales bacterium]